MFSFIQFLNETIDYKELKGTKNNWAPYYVRHADIEGRRIYSVYQQAHKVGEATLSSDKKHVSDVSINKEHRRRGISSALYKHIEDHLGYPLEKSFHQTSDGQSFWKNRK